MLEILVGIGQVLGLARTVESIQRLWSKWRQKPVVETLAGRFFRLFEAHGVHRNQIPRFFGHGLLLKDVQDEAALLTCLTDEHLADACQLFGVQLQWLERGEGNAHVRHQFYLQPLSFGNFLDDLVAARKAVSDVEITATLFGVLDRQSQVESTLVVFEPIGLLNDEVICRYHNVDAGPLGYWKARVSTAALVAQALSRKLWVNGRNCDVKLLRASTYAKELVGIQEHDLLMASSRRFEVDDWLLEPDAFLDDVDPEPNRFGSISALELWLNFDAEGLMEHPYGKSGTRAKFDVALELQKAV